MEIFYYIKMTLRDYDILSVICLNGNYSCVNII